METARRSRRETEENEGERMVTKSGSERGERRRREKGDVEIRRCGESDGREKRPMEEGGERRRREAADRTSMERGKRKKATEEREGSVRRRG
jgi:hypothetical protein